MFRGVVMRGFASVAPVWLAVVGQGLCFGAAHVDPVRGWGNIGLLLVLGTVGAVFGGAAYLLRRIGPTVIAHALYNGVVMVIVLTVHP
jgi:membrane protease YdiL (CAAX protease family)